MSLSSYCFILGGIGSLLIAVLHVALAVRPQWYRCFGGDELAQLAEQGSRLIVVVTIGLALMFVAWGAYAFSGAGVIGELPLLQAVVIAIGVLYTLGSLLQASEFLKTLRSGLSFRFVLFSMGALAMGLLHLIGAFAR